MNLPPQFARKRGRTSEGVWGEPGAAVEAEGTPTDLVRAHLLRLRPASPKIVFCVAVHRRWQEEIDDVGDGVEEITDAQLAMFDLDGRGGLLQAGRGDGRWCSEAKAEALKVRQGVTKYILWWARAKHAATPMTHLRLDPGTGVFAFRVSQ